MSQPTFIDGIGYEGKVTLTLKSNDRVLQSRTYKNRGTSTLFKFLGYCLMGDYATASAYLPTKIMLLKNKSATPEEAERTPTDVDTMSSYQPVSQSPSWGNAIGGEEVKVVYSFEVPKTSIDTEGTFNQVALYRANPDNIGDFLAFYVLKDDSGNFDDTLQASEWSPTTVLLIEWELTLSNKNVSANTPTAGTTSNGGEQ